MSQSAGEFELIDQIVATLGAQAAGRWIKVGPGDDCSVVAVSAQIDVVGSIDTLVADVHFPLNAPAELIGYRSLMVCLSDLAAMAATPRYALVALTLPDTLSDSQAHSLPHSLPSIDAQWLRSLAQGMASAASAADTYICGGNLARGPLSISVSVHGEVPSDKALLRSTAAPGDQLWVTGALGGAAACVRTAELTVEGSLTSLQAAFYKPQARFDLRTMLQERASAGLDLSDGLLQDAGHMARASGVDLHIDSQQVPVADNAELNDALRGGDDYELLLSAPAGVTLDGCTLIGHVGKGTGQVLLDGQVNEGGGYDHFK